MKTHHQEQCDKAKRKGLWLSEYRALPVNPEYDHRLPLSRALFRWSTDTPKRLAEHGEGCTRLNFHVWCTLTLAAHIVEQGWTPAIGACLEDTSIRCDCLDPEAYLFSADAAIRRAAHELGFTALHVEEALEGYHVTLIYVCCVLAWRSISAQKVARIMRRAAAPYLT